MKVDISIDEVEFRLRQRVKLPPKAQGPHRYAKRYRSLARRMLRRLRGGESIEVIIIKLKELGVVR